MLGGAGVAQAAPALEAHGSVEQVYATGLAPGAKVTLYGGGGGGDGAEEAHGTRAGGEGDALRREWGRSRLEAGRRTRRGAVPRSDPGERLLTRRRRRTVGI